MNLLFADMAILSNLTYPILESYRTRMEDAILPEESFSARLMRPTLGLAWLTFGAVCYFVKTHSESWSSTEGWGSWTSF